MFKVGDIVEREIDGLWFPARIECSKDKGRSYSVRFMDDMKVEDDVLSRELRRFEGDLAQFDINKTGKVVETLQKPLAGKYILSYDVQSLF